MLPLARRANCNSIPQIFIEQDGGWLSVPETLVHNVHQRLTGQETLDVLNEKGRRVLTVRKCQITAVG
jgi:hypothetical protein